MSPPDLRREPSSARGLTPPRSESKEAARPEPEPDKTQFARMTHTFFLPASSRLLRLPPASSRWVASTRTQFSFSRASAGFLFGKRQPIQEKPAGSRLNEEYQFGVPSAPPAGKPVADAEAGWKPAERTCLAEQPAPAHLRSQPRAEILSERGGVSPPVLRREPSSAGGLTPPRSESKKATGLTPQIRDACVSLF